MDMLENISKDLIDICNGKLVNIFGSSKLVLILNENFILEKFINSAKKLTDELGIPINIVNDESEIYLKNIEIYIIIRNKKMIIYTSHKYYDGLGFFIVMNRLDNIYNDKMEDNKINNLISKDKNTQNSFLNNVGLNLFHRNGNDDIPEDLILYKKVFSLSTKTIDILNEFQYLLMDYLIAIDTRTINNLPLNTLGSYFDMYHLKNNEIDSFADKIKNLKQLSDIPPFNIFESKDYIFINSLLKFPRISFFNETLPISQYCINGYGIHKYYMCISGANINGISSIYINKNLYELLHKEKN